MLERETHHGPIPTTTEHAGRDQALATRSISRRTFSALGLAGGTFAASQVLNAPAAHASTLPSVDAIDSVDDLRSTAGDGDGHQVHLLGYYAATPGAGGGTLYWDSASTDSDDGGTIFEVSGVSVGRWKRNVSAEVDLAWFGWTGLGNEDDSWRVQAAIDVLPDGGVVMSGPGLVRIENTVHVETVPITFKGAGSTRDDDWVTQFVIATGSDDGFVLSSVRGGGFRDLQMRGDSLTGGSFIATEKVGNDDNYMLIFSTVRFKDGYNGITLRSCNTVRFHNCVWNGFNGQYVILLNGVDDASRADPVDFVQCSIAAGPSNPGTDNLIIDGLGGSIKFFATAILFGRHGLWLKNTTSGAVPKFLYFEGGGFENGHGVPVLLDDGSQVQFANTYFSGDGEQDNVRIAPTFTGNAVFSNCVVRGAGRNGLDIGSTRVTVTGCLIGNNGRTAHSAFARTITNVADNGSGNVRITTSAAHGWETDDRVTVQDVTGTTEANGKWKITVVGANTFDLEDVAFSNSYSGGGSAWRNGAGVNIRQGASRVALVGNIIGPLADGTSRQDFGIYNDASDVLVSNNDLAGNVDGPYQLAGSLTSNTRFIGNKGLDQIDGWLTAYIDGAVTDGLYNLDNFLYLVGQRIWVTKVIRKLSTGSCDVRLDADGSSAGGFAAAVSTTLQATDYALPFSVDGLSGPKKLQVRVLNSSSAEGLEVQLAYQVLS